MLRRSLQFLVLTLACTLAAAGVAAAQGAGAHPVEGSYAVTAVGEQIGTVNFNMALKKVADKWVGEISDSPVPMTIKTVTVDAENKVTITASTGDAEVIIIGKLDAGKIAGDWTAGDAKGTWSAMRKEVVAKTAQVGTPSTGAAAGAPSVVTNASLEGTYDAEVTAEGQGSLPFLLIVKRSGDKLVAEAQNGGDLNITGIEINGEAVTLNATFQGNPFALPGKLTGSNMSGKWEAGGFSGSWSAKKK